MTDKPPRDPDDVGAHDSDIAELWDVVDALIEALINGQIEMRALQLVLAANHGLSLDALREAADFQKAKDEARQAPADTASHALTLLKRFRGRGRVQ